MIIPNYDRLVLDIHGIGAKPHWVGADEDLYWCDEASTYFDLLDSIPEFKAATGLEVELTFDDGNKSDYTIAFPALVERGLSATFFVCAGRIGEPGYLDASLMRSMVDAGMTFGSHGWSHIDWRKASDVSLDREINGARKAIEDTISRTVNVVAVPFGSYDRRTMNALREFERIYTSDKGLALSANRIVPRWSYQKIWNMDHKTLINIAEISRRMTFILQLNIKSKLKRLR
jgi:peptidoglycan/xylan/chitin deacetylase (PgdA/CDA1 family)